MSADARKRQKKLERRSAKRKDKRSDIARVKNMSMAERLAAAVNCPILHCWIGNNFYSAGIGWVVLSRVLPDGSVAVANFLVDRYCLGVKNVHMEVLPRPVYEAKYIGEMYDKMDLRDAAPVDARGLLEQAVAYAKSIGFAPHWDYAKALAIFAAIDPKESSKVFEFGKEGKPFFMSGPNDSPERCRQIVATLQRTCGEGNYHVMMAISPSTGLTLLQD